MTITTKLRRTLLLTGATGLLFGIAAAPAVAVPPPPPMEVTAAAPAAPSAEVDNSRFPSEWSSPNGDWAISTVHDGQDTRLAMGTWSHRGDIRVFITDPAGKRTFHDFTLVESAAMESWYEFSDSWRAHYPDAGPGQYKVVFAMKTSKGWQNICDKTLGFVVR